MRSSPSATRISRGFEEFDHVPGRVFEQDLLATLPGYDLVPEGSTLVAQPLDSSSYVFDLYLEAVPSSGFGVVTRP